MDRKKERVLSKYTFVFYKARSLYKHEKAYALEQETDKTLFL
jgi:hypothetical protein